MPLPLGEAKASITFTGRILLNYLTVEQKFCRELPNFTSSPLIKT